MITLNRSISNETNAVYIEGDERVNVWPGLTALHNTFVREHNRIADVLYAKMSRVEPLLDRITLDEEAYQQARRIIAAQLQVEILLPLFCRYIWKLIFSVCKVKNCDIVSLFGSFFCSTISLSNIT